MGSAIFRKDSSGNWARVRKIKVAQVAYGNYLADDYTYTTLSPGYLTPAEFLPTVDPNFAVLARVFSLDMSDYTFIVCKLNIKATDQQYDLYVNPKGSSMFTTSEDNHINFSNAVLYSMWGRTAEGTFQYVLNQGTQHSVDLDESTYTTLDFNVRAEKLTFIKSNTMRHKDGEAWRKINL